MNANRRRSYERRFFHQTFKKKWWQGFIRPLANISEGGGGGQGWIRTSVRKPGQIYSLLPLTTRPPVHEVRRAKWRRTAGLSMLETPPLAAFVRPNHQPASARSLIGAGEGNRTPVVSLGSCCSTIELHPHAVPQGLAGSLIAAVS